MMPEELWDAEMVNVAEDIRELTGKECVFVLRPIECETESGAIFQARGVITEDKIILQADHSRYTIGALAMHEEYHAMEDADPGLHEAVRERIVETFGEKRFQAIMNRYINGMKGVIDYRNMESGEAFEAAVKAIEQEMFADAYAGINSFSSGVKDFGNAVIDTMDEREQRAQRASNGTKETRGPPLKGLELPSPYDTGEKYSIEKTRNDKESFERDKYFDRQIDKWEDKPDGSRIKVGVLKKGSALNKVGFPAEGMWFDVGKIKKSFGKHGDHLTKSIMKQIPDLLNDPVAITEYKGPEGNINNTVNVFGMIMPDGKTPVVVGVMMTKARNGETIINKIRTIHAHGNAEINDSNILYLNEDKKRTRRWFQVCGNSVPLEGTTFGFIRSIAYTDAKSQGINTDKKITEKFSFDDESDEEYMSAVESGDTETAQRMVDEAAKKAFPNTKITDDEGNPLVVFHGTSESFTVFDMSRGRANMDIQGSFFSPWELDASGYGENVNAYYLNITNPADERTAYRALNKFKGQNNAGIKARKLLESMGYDGVNNSDEEYIAFSPKQIKLADPVTYDDNGNVIPLSERFNSSSDDIRFSFDDDAEPERTQETALTEEIEKRSGTEYRKELFRKEGKAALLENDRQVKALQRRLELLREAETTGRDEGTAMILRFRIILWKTVMSVIMFCQNVCITSTGTEENSTK